MQRSSSPEPSPLPFHEPRRMKWTVISNAMKNEHVDVFIDEF